MAFIKASGQELHQQTKGWLALHQFYYLPFELNIFRNQISTYRANQMPRTTHRYSSEYFKRNS